MPPRRTAFSSTVASLCFAGPVLIALTLVLPAAAFAQAPPDLSHFTTFTLTGDYVVAGVDLQPQSQGNGYATGTIQVSGVPANADIVAAYLYWETIAASPSQLSGALFRGEPVSAIKTSSVSLTGPYATCYAGGGNTLSMMRADVRRLLPPQLDANGKPTGKRVVNHADLQKYQQQFPDDKWLLTVTLPDGGAGQLPTECGSVSADRLSQSGSAARRSRSAPAEHRRLRRRACPGAERMTTVHTIRGFLQSAVACTAGQVHEDRRQRRARTRRTSVVQERCELALIATDVAPPVAEADRGWSNPTFPVILSEYVDNIRCAIRRTGPDYESITRQSHPMTASRWRQPCSAPRSRTPMATVSSTNWNRSAG